MNILYENKRAAVYCRNSNGGKNPLTCIAHLHYHIELALILRGDVKANIDSGEYLAKENDIILVYPNQIHRFESLTPDGDYLLFIFNPDIIPEYGKQISAFLPESNLIADAGNDPQIRELADRLFDTYFSKDSMREIMFRGYMLVFFGNLLKRITLKDIRSQDMTVLGMILNYCTNNSEKNLSLSLLEKELHVSKYYISHLLRNKLKIGFNDYINSIRVSKACELLLQSDKPVTEISDTVGFNTLRTFNRAFLKQVGITPSAYRSIQKNTDKPMNSTVLI